jgi:hypothetical protein
VSVWIPGNVAVVRRRNLGWEGGLAGSNVVARSIISRTEKVNDRKCSSRLLLRGSHLEEIRDKGLMIDSTALF